MFVFQQIIQRDKKSAVWGDGGSCVIILFSDQNRSSEGFRLWRRITPDGKAHENGIVLRAVRQLPGNFGPGGLVLHLDGRVALLVHPVEVFGRVGRDGFDLKELGIYSRGQRFGKLRRNAAGGKIRNQCFGHNIYLPNQSFE